MNFQRRALITITLLVSFISFVAYLRTLSCDFVNWDDTEYVINNTFIRTLDWDFLVKAFTTMESGHWLPLTWISFAIDYHFWELNPLGYHLTNILFYAVDAGLVVLIADGLFRKRFTKIEASSSQKYLYPCMLLASGLLFGIHPARVESVAWVTERKDVLMGIFAFSSILFYLKYLRNKEHGQAKGAALRYYFFSLVLYLLSLMVKPISIVVPFMLLIMDWYPLGRVRKGTIFPVVVEKIPFLVPSFIIMSITIYHNKVYGDSAFISMSNFPLSVRAITTGNSFYEYFKLMLFPVGILPYYHLPFRIPQVFVVKAIIFLCFLYGCIYWGRKRPWFMATLVAFIVPFSPVMQFLANGFQPALCSRYTFLPSLLPSIYLGCKATETYRDVKKSWQPYRLVVAAVLFVSVSTFYFMMTQHLIGVWKDSGTMWSRVISYQPFDRAYYYRALFYVDAGNYPAAVADYTSCLKLATEEKMPDLYNIYAFRGEALTKAGRYAEAVSDFNVAIEMFPHRLFYYHRGLALSGLGRTKEADEDFLRAGRAKGQMYWFPLGSSLS